MFYDHFSARSLLAKLLGRFLVRRTNPHDLHVLSNICAKEGKIPWYPKSPGCKLGWAIHTHFNVSANTMV